MENLPIQPHHELDCTFVKDDFYENIQAPKWIDFELPEDPVDDHEWFCKRAGCTHEEKPICKAYALSPTAAATQSQRILQTIPEDMTMTRKSLPTHKMMIPSVAEKVLATCNGLAYSLFVSFFCCF